MSPKRRMQSVTAISTVAQGFSLYMYIKSLLNVYRKKELFTRDVIKKNQKIGAKTAETLVLQCAIPQTRCQRLFQRDLNE